MCHLLSSCVYVCVIWVKWYEGWLGEKGESYIGDMVGGIRASVSFLVTSYDITHSVISLLSHLLGVLQS